MLIAAASPPDTAGWNWAVVDACADPRLPGLLLADQAGATSLWRLPDDDPYHQVAPFLLRWPRPWWSVLNALPSHWGLLLEGPDNRDAVIDHLRRFLSVRSPAGETWLFRYYDPRVLEPFLRASSAGEQTAFFGPLLRIGCPTDDGMPTVHRRDAIGQAEGNAGRVRLSGSLRRAPAGPLFQLRGAHVAAFHGQADTALIDRIAGQLDPALLDGLPPDRIAARLRTGVARARSRHGVEGEDALAAFVAFMLEIGPRFDEVAEIAWFLANGRGDPDTRVLELADRVSAGAWDQAASAPVTDDWPIEAELPL